jgi:hypothetical protein
LAASRKKDLDEDPSDFRSKRKEPAKLKPASTLQSSKSSEGVYGWQEKPINKF